MFDNYNNLSTSYIPNNQNITDTFNRIEFNNKEPRKEFSNDGLFIGYSWNYGDTVEIPYSIYKTIPVEDNAIIYYESGKGPSKDTVGLFNQKAYNIVDLKLWICKTLDQSIYNWVEQDKFTYPTHGKKMVTLNSDIDMSDVCGSLCRKYRRRYQGFSIFGCNQNRKKRNSFLSSPKKYSQNNSRRQAC